MHTEARVWLVESAGLIDDLRLEPDYGRVVEFGALNVNGSAREQFQLHASEYLGIDIVSGPGVDLTIDAAEWDGQGGWDIVVCTEVLEHSKKAQLIVQSAARALKPGGFLVLTCASDKRKPHSAYGAEHPLPGEYYRGVPMRELLLWLVGAGLVVVTSRELADPGDLQVVAQRAV